MKDGTLTAMELVRQLRLAEQAMELVRQLRLAEPPSLDPFHLPVYMACDADPGYVHRIAGVRRVEDRLVIDIDYDCDPEKL